VVDTVNAGKDIYCEKPMSHTAAEGFDMAAAQQKTGRIVQIGSQRVSSVIYAKARDMIAKGAIGDVNLVEGTLGRNDPTGCWEYPPPPDLSPQTLDWDTWQGTVPKRAFDPLIYARWRCWKEYGTGVAGDLLVHLVSGILYGLGLNEPPKRAMATGGILRWKDGRNMPDVHASLFEYGNLPVYTRLNLGAESPEVVRFQGSKGILEVGEFSMTYSPQTGLDTAPSYYAFGFPKALREEYFKQWHAEHDPAIGQEPIAEMTTYRGPSYDDVKPHLWRFFEAVRTRKPVTEDAVFGNHAALACHMANESYFRKTVVSLDVASKSIKS
jgi:predicted dehydrogenase